MISQRMRIGRFLPALGLVLALPACSFLGPDEPPAVTPSPAPTASAGGEAQPQVPRPQPRPKAPPRPTGEVAALPAPPPKLVGMSEKETIEALGRPSEEVSEPPGKVWLYKATGCQLSVHLFPDMEKGGFYTLDYTADGARDVCLGKVAGEARRRGG